MSSLILRLAKGSPLTNAEVDGNFSALNADKIEADDTRTLTNKVIDSITNTVGADHIHFKVKATEAIAKGQVVRAVGFNAGDNAFEVALVTSAAHVAIGVSHDTLISGAFGAVINTGLLENFDTSAFAEGAILYPNTSGGFTATQPSSGTYQALAFVVRSHANHGAVLIEASDPAPVRTSSNVGNTVVLRDASGNFSAGTVTATSFAGSASGLTGLKTVNGNSILGSGNIQIDGGVTSFNTRTGAVSLSSGDVTGALGFTPYNATNPSGYITSSGSISGNAATATNISNTGTVTLASATESNSIYITAPSYTTDTPVKLLNFDWYGNLFSMGNIRSGSTPSNGFGIYYTASGGSRTEIARFGTGGSFNAIGAITQNGNQVLHAGNYTSYSPSLTGSGASGTWGINISGAAASAVTLSNNASISGLNFSGVLALTASGASTGNATGARLTESYGPVWNLGDGATWHYQIMNGSLLVGISAGGTNYGSGNIRAAGNIYAGTSNLVLHASNYSSYALPLSGGTLSGNLTMSGGDVYMNSNKWIYFQYTAGGEQIRINNSSAGHLDVYSQTNARFADVRAREFVRGDGSTILHAGNYSNYTDSRYVSNLARVRTFLIDGLGASGTQARRYEIARIAIDYNDWNSVGSFEVELFETYFAASMKKRYQVTYGYGGQNYATLVEMIGGGTNSFQVTVGSPIQVSGDHYYLPVYVDVRYYAACAARITTSRYISTASTPGIGDASVFVTPGGVNISDFSPDSTVNMSNSASAWQVGGNTVLHAGNYTSYSPSLTGSGASGTWGISISGSAAQLGGFGAARFIKTSYDHAGDWTPTGVGNFVGGWHGPTGGGDGYISLGSSTHALNLIIDGDYYAGASSANRVLHAGNYSSYALPLSGGTVSGNQTITGTLTVSSGNTTGGGIILADDGDIVDLNDAYCSMRFSSGVRVFSANRGGSAVHTLHSNGTFTASGNITAYSDERLKKDWAPLANGFVERLAAVKSGTYTRIDNNKRQAGSSAQDWQQLLPEVVTEADNEEKTLSLAYGNAAVVSAIELAKKVVEQDERIKRLEALVEKLIGD